MAELKEAPVNTLVLLDPTADDGESALDLLTRADQHVSLLVLLSGPSSAALSTYARCEGIDLATAGWNYLDQVAGRIGRPERLVETIIATGPDAEFEVSTIVAHNGIDRVVLPSSMHVTDGAAARRLCETHPDVSLAEPVRRAS